MAHFLQQKSNAIKQAFLATFFVDNNLDHIVVNGFHLVRNYHGVTGEPIIAIYSELSFQARNNYLAQQSQLFSDGGSNLVTSQHREVPDHHEEAEGLMGE